jgi:hypothetical protein
VIPRVSLSPPVVGPPGVRPKSFSGLKTALLRARDALVAEKGGITVQDRRDLCAGFQAAVAAVLAEKTRRALAVYLESAPAHGACRGGGCCRKFPYSGHVRDCLHKCSGALCRATAAALHRQRRDDRLGRDRTVSRRVGRGGGSDRPSPLAVGSARRTDDRIGEERGEGMIAVIGAGAFGTALAVALARNGQAATLWARDPEQVAAMAATRRNPTRLPGIELPENVTVTAQMADLSGADAVLLSLPMQSLRAFLSANRTALDGIPLVACCKGMDLSTLTGPSEIIRAECPNSPIAVLTGPSFAADIARGLPTALTLACSDHRAGEALQHLLATPCCGFIAAMM